MRQLIKLKQPRTILCDKWVIGGAEIDEPVPIPKLPQQNRGGVKRVCDHGGSPVRDEIRLLYNPHIPEPLEQRVALHEPHQIGAFLRRGFEVQVDHVAVVGVVEGQEDAGDGGAVALWAGDEVGEARRRGEGGDDGEGAELGFDEDGVGGGGDGAVEGEDGGSLRGGEGGEEEEEEGADLREPQKQCHSHNFFIDLGLSKLSPN